MLLVIDIGNSSILFGIYNGKELLHNWKTVTDVNRTPEEYKVDIIDRLHKINIPESRIDGVGVSCVIPSLESVFKDVCKECFNVQPLFVNEDIDIGIKILCDKPKEVGADRIANAVAAFELYKKSVIVVDFGTAVTFDVVTEKGEYAGGVIAAGIKISTEALATKTARLPEIKVVKPENVVGKNTVESMRAGIFYGFIGQVKEIISRIKDEIKVNPMVIGTGGYIGLMEKETGLFDKIHPTLILEGLRIIWQRNQ